jgi:hypothetical protein
MCLIQLRFDRIIIQQTSYINVYTSFSSWLQRIPRYCFNRTSQVPKAGLQAVALLVELRTVQLYGGKKDPARLFVVGNSCMNRSDPAAF